eukprot:scaffold11596_cov79-Skeletonema_dohrnii-CCMP3373.AAC.7
MTITQHQDAHNNSGIACNVNVNDDTKEAPEKNDRVEVELLRMSSSFILSIEKNAAIPWQTRPEKKRRSMVMGGQLHILAVGE